MPTLYHGTSRDFATAMAGDATTGAIDVTMGRGEFGRGFYTQTSSGNAYRRAQSLHGSANSAMLTLEIDDVAFHTLDLQHLTLNMAQKLDASLRQNHTQGSYTTSHDAIIGPLVGQPKIEQQKFQTGTAQTLLNGADTIRSVS